MARTFIAWLMLTSLVGCSGGSDGGGGSGAGGAPANLAPTWGGSTTLSVCQGTEKKLPVGFSDPEGDAFDTIASAPPNGIELVLSKTDLAVRPGYEVSGKSVVNLTATDVSGATTTTPIDVDVAPLGWTERLEWAPGQGPEAREHSAIFYDAARSEVFVSHGSGYEPYGTPLDDAWAFNPKTGAWREVATSGDVPPGAGSRRIAGPRDGAFYMFGGYGANQAMFGELYRVTVDSTGALAFTEIAQQNPPPARALHTFAYDAKSDAFFLFGGAGTMLYGDTWAMKLEGDTAVWERLELDPAPTPRYGAFAGVDAEAGRLIVFSGQTSSKNEFSDETWSFDFAARAWTLLTPANPPNGRRNGTAVFDSTGPRLFVFGGTSDGVNSEPGLFVLDARAGHEAWTRLEREGEAPIRSSGFGIAVDGRVWMGFGNTISTEYRDLAALGCGS